MVFQNVTPLPSISAMMTMETSVLLPCPVTTGYQQSEPANVADVGLGLGVSPSHLNNCNRVDIKYENFTVKMKNGKKFVK
jgi:hypothetical protein